MEAERTYLLHHDTSPARAAVVQKQQLFHSSKYVHVATGSMNGVSRVITESRPPTLFIRGTSCGAHSFSQCCGTWRKTRLRCCMHKSMCAARSVATLRQTGLTVFALSEPHVRACVLAPKKTTHCRVPGVWTRRRRTAPWSWRRALRTGSAQEPCLKHKEQLQSHERVGAAEPGAISVEEHRVRWSCSPLKHCPLGCDSRT